MTFPAGEYAERQPFCYRDVLLKAFLCSVVMPRDNKSYPFLINEGNEELHRQFHVLIMTLCLVTAINNDGVSTLSRFPSEVTPRSTHPDVQICEDAISAVGTLLVRNNEVVALTGHCEANAPEALIAFEPTIEGDGDDDGQETTAKRMSAEPRVPGNGHTTIANSLVNPHSETTTSKHCVVATRTSHIHKIVVDKQPYFALGHG